MTEKLIPTPIENKQYEFALINGLKEENQKLKAAIREIENSMERWHLARDNSDETLENINETLVKLGLLSFFNK